MAKKLGYLFTLAVPVVVVGLGLAWTLGLGVSAGGNLVYETAPASRGAVRKTVSTSGPVRALVTVSVGSQLSGQVDDVRVDFNSEVRPGDVMATIDAKTFAARVAQGRADLAAAEAALLNQEAALVKAQSVLKLAELNIERQKKLADKGYAAQSVLDTATRDAEVAEADIAVANAQIASARATIEQRKAQLDQYRIDLERTEIRAPIEGTVISRTVDPGQTVAASLQAPELFKIAQDLSRIRIEAQVNEADVGAVATGNPAQFTVDAYPDRQFEGKVTQVRLASTELNNVVTYTVIIEAVNEDRKLFPGMTANVQIESAKRDGVLRVTNDALRFRPQSTTGAGGRHDAGDRTQRLVERLKTELELTPEQEKLVADEVERMRSEFGLGAPDTGQLDRSTQRQRMTARLEQVLAAGLSDVQRRQFDMWKQGRETVRHATVWVLGADGKPERRGIRVGISDDQFTEVTGGDLKDGDPVILRTREVKK